MRARQQWLRSDSEQVTARRQECCSRAAIACRGSPRTFPTAKESATVLGGEASVAMLARLAVGDVGPAMNATAPTAQRYAIVTVTSRPIRPCRAGANRSFPVQAEEGRTAPAGCRSGEVDPTRPGTGGVLLTVPWMFVACSSQLRGTDPRLSCDRFCAAAKGRGDRATTPLASSVPVFGGPCRVPAHGPPRGADPCAPLFASLPADELIALEGRVSAPGYIAGERIYRAGDRAGSLFVVASGAVKLLRPSPRGDNAVVSVLGPGDSFGTLTRIEHCAETAVAMVDSCIIGFR
jgi:hypothetical protein